MTFNPAPPDHPTLPSVAILGGGITGLSAAWHLRQAGAPVTLFESSGRVGGAIESIRQGEWLHEGGPNSLLEGSPELEELIQGLHLENRRLYASPAAKNRYVVRDGRLRAMPTSPLGFLRSRLFSPRAKLRLATEPFRRLEWAEDESLAEFTRRRLGREFLDYAVDPFVGGVYAGDPARLSARHAFPKLVALEREYGSLIRGAIRKRNRSGGPSGRMFSFGGGLQELPEALAGAVCGSLRLRTRILSLRRRNQEWLIAFERDGQTHLQVFSAVLCALPAPALAALEIEGLSPGALSVLGEIEHPPVASVFLGFRRSDVEHPLNGFGVLAPKVEHDHILGALFSSTLFPGRAPEGHVAITAFVGGTRQPQLARLDDNFLVRLAASELERWLGIRDEPVFSSVRRHPRAIPQYNLGYQRFKDACTAAEEAAPGLFIGGNCRDGISVPACIASGRRLAKAALGIARVSPRYALSA